MNNTSHKDYLIQGLDLLELAQEYGLPLYVYDMDRIRKQVEHFRKAFHGLPLQIRYAMKANSNLSILRFMKKLGTGLDTVSVTEIEMGIMAGFSPDQIVFTPNLVHFDEIKQAVERGVAVNIDNLSNLEQFGKVFGDHFPCGIRLNPHIIAEYQQEKVTAWHRQSKFGISVSQFGKLREVIRKYSIRVNGIHIHSSHQILTTEVFLKAARMIFRLADDFPGLDYLDFGGGIRVPHQEEEKTIDLLELGELFRPVFIDFSSRYGRDIQLWFEPGRYLVSDSGILLTRVEVLKTNGQVDFAGVNTGFNHFIRPMMYGASHRILNLSHPSGLPKPYHIAGNLCETDNFATDRQVPEIREGDVLAILNAGAYGYSMSSSYNSRLRPAELAISGGKAILIRPRETLEDLTRNQIITDL